jgi:hypothetical protein
MHLPAGTAGFCVGLGLFLLVRYIADKRTPQGGPFTFGSNFEPRLANYIRAVEYLLGMATASIVLLVGSSGLHENGKLPWAYASPLMVLGCCVIYGVLFMVLLIFNYEGFMHDNQSYTRTRYVRNQGLGFTALACFCLGYFWLICSVSLTLAK